MSIYKSVLILLGLVGGLFVSRSTPLEMSEDRKKKTNQKEEWEAADFVGNYYFCDAVWLSGTSIADSPELPYLDPRGVIVVCRELLD